MLGELKQLLAKIHDLNSAAAVLEWDQETYMPAGAAEARAHQIATLRQLSHEYFTSDEMGRLLGDLSAHVASTDPDSFECALLRVTRRDFDKEIKIPSSLVAEMTEATSLARQAWKNARENSAYALFAPHLERIIQLSVRKAEAYGYDNCAYDALLDQYEPGMKTAEVEAVFDNLREHLVPIVKIISELPAPDDSVLRQHFDRQKQWDFGIQVLHDLGYDFNHGRQDISTHPFTTTFSIADVRITSRFDEAYLPSALFGTIHEAGHGLYEQGIGPVLERTPLAEGTSLGMHESQSRLWENLIGRSRSFWTWYYPRLKAVFPDQLEDVTPDTFFKAINKVKPSLIRVEADELTYNLHIMVRFEIEKAMIEGQVDVNDLPALWNEKMETYLGLTPANDAEGILQDIHWSLGAIGYFPTYTLGNLISTQLFQQARTDLPDMERQIAVGQFSDLLNWLRRHVHRHGRKLTATEILERVTGAGLDAQSWLSYVKDKYGQLYGALF